MHTILQPQDITTQGSTQKFAYTNLDKTIKGELE